MGITMYVLDDSEVITIPKLTAVNIISDTQIDFVIEDVTPGLLEYLITTDNNGLTVTNSTGSVNMDGNAVTISKTVAPTDTVGTYTHTIKLTNAQGSVLEADFMTRVISEVNFADSSINIAPVITNIAIDRNGDTLSVKADAVDDNNNSDLTYAWSFTAKSFVDAATNPATLTAFEDGTTGTLNVVVTDSEGAETNASYAVASNQFPDITAPSITSITPNDNASDVAVDSVITIEFNEAVQSSSITSNSVIVSDGINAVAGTLNSTGSTVTFTPDADFAYEANYIVTVTADVKDVSGNNLTAGVVSGFGTDVEIVMPTEGLLLHYTFDNVIGNTVYSEVGDYNGTLTDSAQVNVDGHHGNSIITAGNQDYGSFVGNGEEFDTLLDYTYSFWIKPTTFTNLGLIGYGHNTILIYIDNTTTMYVSNAGTQSGPSSTELTNTMILNEWNHIAIRRTSGKLEILVSDLILNTNSDNPTALGKENASKTLVGGPTTNYSEALYDTVRLYNRALSQEEISALANEQ
jgi:hypothetical protein